MTKTVFTYPVTIKETHLDSFGHVNNSVYLTLFEEARWEYITSRGYGIDQIVETGLGPVILSIKLDFLKELRPRDTVNIEIYQASFIRKIGNMTQAMIKDGEVCATAEITFGLFSLKQRKLVTPTPKWLDAIEAIIKRN